MSEDEPSVEMESDDEESEIITEGGEAESITLPPAPSKMYEPEPRMESDSHFLPPPPVDTSGFFGQDEEGGKEPERTLADEGDVENMEPSGSTPGEGLPYVMNIIKTRSSIGRSYSEYSSKVDRQPHERFLPLRCFAKGSSGGRFLTFRDSRGELWETPYNPICRSSNVSIQRSPPSLGQGGGVYAFSKIAPAHSLLEAQRALYMNCSMMGSMVWSEVKRYLEHRKKTASGSHQSLVGGRSKTDLYEYNRESASYLEGANRITGDARIRVKLNPRSDFTTTFSVPYLEQKNPDGWQGPLIAACQAMLDSTECTSSSIGSPQNRRIDDLICYPSHKPASEMTLFELENSGGILIPRFQDDVGNATTIGHKGVGHDRFGVTCKACGHPEGGCNGCVCSCEEDEKGGIVPLETYADMIGGKGKGKGWSSGSGSKKGKSKKSGISGKKRKLKEAKSKAEKMLKASAQKRRDKKKRKKQQQQQKQKKDQKRDKYGKKGSKYDHDSDDDHPKKHRKGKTDADEGYARDRPYKHNKPIGGNWMKKMSISSSSVTDSKTSTTIADTRTSYQPPPSTEAGECTLVPTRVIKCAVPVGNSTTPVCTESLHVSRSCRGNNMVYPSSSLATTTASVTHTHAGENGESECTTCHPLIPGVPAFPEDVLGEFSGPVPPRYRQGKKRLFFQFYKSFWDQVFDLLPKVLAGLDSAKRVAEFLDVELGDGSNNNRECEVDVSKLPKDEDVTTAKLGTSWDNLTKDIYHFTHQILTEEMRHEGGWKTFLSTFFPETDMFVFLAVQRGMIPHLSCDIKAACRISGLSSEMMSTKTEMASAKQKVKENVTRLVRVEASLVNVYETALSDPKNNVIPADLEDLDEAAGLLLELTTKEINRQISPELVAQFELAADTVRSVGNDLKSAQKYLREITVRQESVYRSKLRSAKLGLEERAEDMFGRMMYAPYDAAFRAKIEEEADRMEEEITFVGGSGKPKPKNLGPRSSKYDKSKGNRIFRADSGLGEKVDLRKVTFTNPNPNPNNSGTRKEGSGTSKIGGSMSTPSYQYDQYESRYPQNRRRLVSPVGDPVLEEALCSAMDGSVGETVLYSGDSTYYVPPGSCPEAILESSLPDPWSYPSERSLADDMEVMAYQNSLAEERSRLNPDFGVMNGDGKGTLLPWFEKRSRGGDPFRGCFKVGPNIVMEEDENDVYACPQPPPRSHGSNLVRVREREGCAVVGSKQQQQGSVKSRQGKK